MKHIYLEDSYTKKFTATITRIDGKAVYLDQTAFYPQGGGQPSDTGTITRNGDTFNVEHVKKDEHGVRHELNKEGLNEGDTITGNITWERRYKLMRIHTAAHCLSATIHNTFGAKITGNNLDTEKSRIDFNLDEIDKDAINNAVRKLNETIAQGAPVRVTYMDREQALQDPQLVKLAGRLPPAIQELRIVTIDGIDRQCDGGTHVKDAQEIGTIEILNVENKGKQNRRIYFTVR